jgi:hypothetical protein
MKLTPEQKAVITKMKKATNKAISEAYTKTTCRQTRNQIFIQAWELFEKQKQEVIKLGN